MSILFAIQGVGNLRPAGRIRPAKQNLPARGSFTNKTNCNRREGSNGSWGAV